MSNKRCNHEVDGVVCESDLFRVDERDDCGGCPDDHYYNVEGDHFNCYEVPEGVERNGVEQDDECWRGQACGDGCWVFACAACGHEWFIGKYCE